MNPHIFAPFNIPHAVLNIVNSPRCYLHISTRIGNILVDWGDGVRQNLVVAKNAVGELAMTQITHTYASNFTGNVKITSTNGLSDIYGILLSDDAANTTGTAAGSSQATQYNVSVDFVKQFPNLIFMGVDLYYYTNLGYTGVSITGDWSQIPNSVENLFMPTVNVNNRPTINVNNFSPLSKLNRLTVNYQTSLNVGGARVHRVLITGDLKNLPPEVTYAIPNMTTTGCTYSGGKVWKTPTELIRFFCQATLDTQTPVTMGATSNNNLLIDLANSATSWTATGNRIQIGGNRSSASDAAVATLNSRGITVSMVTI